MEIEEVKPPLIYMKGFLRLYSGGLRYLSRYFKKFNEESFCLLLI